MRGLKHKFRTIITIKGLITTSGDSLELPVVDFVKSTKKAIKGSTIHNEYRVITKHKMRSVTDSFNTGIRQSISKGVDNPKKASNHTGSMKPAYTASGQTQRITNIKTE
jgi:hypothetical protein